ncbi:NIPSNAP family protein [Corallococcus coralloides]|uniref:NIPSNAP family protein n=1 Tax=Corallococcus coralloides TaxID=184914 RepID=UPI003850EE93
MPSSCCSVLELRQYTLHPGQRDVLISLFERAFIESQEVTGMHLIGQFRDEDRPDRFVWLRGFRDMASRREALSAFYGGPVWKEHRSAANVTMQDSDNVLLLRPVRSDTGLAHPGTPRPAPETDTRPDSRVVVTVCYLKAPAENTFPALPVRTGEHVFAWLTVFPDAARHREHLRRRAAAKNWAEPLQPWLSAPVEHLTLSPTARSELR